MYIKISSDSESCPTLEGVAMHVIIYLESTVLCKQSLLFHDKGEESICMFLYKNMELMAC